MQKATSLQGIKKREKKNKNKNNKRGRERCAPAGAGRGGGSPHGAAAANMSAFLFERGGRLGQHGPAARMRGAAPLRGRGGVSAPLNGRRGRARHGPLGAVRGG